jgi:hypothetical protein
MRKVILVMAGMCVLFASAEAIADPTFGFITMDRMDRTSRIGGQIGFPVLHGDGLENVTFLRTELYGQGAWEISDNAAGIYGHFPVSHALISEGGEDETALANLELGGFFVVGAEQVDLVLRGGLSLPTADDGFVGQLTNVFSSFDRLTDIAGIYPDTLWFRLSVSPIVKASDELTFRADAGVDIPVDAGDNAFDEVLAHFNFGLGFAVAEQVGLSAELVNVASLAGDYDFEDRFLHTLAFGIRGLGKIQPYFAFVLPLDSDINDELFVLTAGLQGTFE